MMTLAIDIGNSFVKLACFNNDNIIKFYKAEGESEAEDMLLKLLPLNPKFAIVSSVKKQEGSFFRTLKNADLELINFNEKLKLPIENKYETPKTLGKDRLANAISAYTIYKNTPCLVIDAGTCIKYDFVDQFGAYVGGSISPGLQMRYKALHHFTDALPLLEVTESFYLIGKNTQESIHSGVLNGAFAEVKGIIEQYQMTQKNLKVVLTGGDYLLFERNLKISIFADPYFTLKGLNEVVKFQYAQATDA